MKILFFIRALTAGGSERQLALLAGGLARRGHDVAVVVFYHGGALEALLDPTKVRLLSVGKTTRWHIAAPLMKLWRLFLSERPDVVCGFLPAQTVLSALLLPPWLQTRLVFRLGAASMDQSREDTLSALVRRSEALLARRADLIIANAQAVRADAVKRGFPSDRLAVLPNGIDTEIMCPAANAGRDLRQQLGIGEKEFVIGMVARLDPMKDHPTFLAAAADFARQHTDARFVCVGDGSAVYRDHLTALTHAYGIGERVIWAGEMARVQDAFNAFDIATLSSAFGEGFPNVVGEAMACGVPVVATDIGDSRFIVDDCGEVVPARNPAALSAGWSRLRQRLNHDPQLCDSVRRRIVAQFSLDAMIDNGEKLFATVYPGGAIAAGGWEASRRNQRVDS